MRIAETNTYMVDAYDDSGIITIKQNYGGDQSDVRFHHEELEMLISVLMEAARIARSKGL